MTSHRVSRSPVHNVLTTVMLVAAAVLIFAGENSVVEADETVPFFVMAAKSVPRMGRRSGTFEDFFLKASKSVPRIGRRGYPPASIKTAELSSWYPKRPSDLSINGGDDLWSSEKYAHELEQSPELWKMMTADGPAEAPTATGCNVSLKVSEVTGTWTKSFQGNNNRVIIVSYNFTTNNNEIPYYTVGLETPFEGSRASVAQSFINERTVQWTHVTLIVACSLFAAAAIAQRCYLRRWKTQGIFRYGFSTHKEN